MPRTLSPLAQEWMDDMPPYYATSDYIQGVVDALAREYQRISDAAADLVSGGFPQNASDVYRLLALWELQMGLDVEPEGVSLADRRQRVMTHLARRRASSERDWAQTLTDAFGTALWTYSTSGGIVTIRMPIAAATLAATQIVALAREITPAHLDVNFAYSEGFILDLSPLDSGSF